MNVIHRQVLDFTIDDSLDYFGLPEKIRALYWDKILPGIDDIFSKLAPADTVYRFDQLEIDLGILTPDMLEGNITVQVEKDLHKTIREALFYGRGGSTTEYPTALSTGRPAEKTELLIHFLQSGIFPWWSASGTATPDTLFQEVIQSGASGFIDFLRHRATPAHIGRLVRQISPKSIEMLLKTTGRYLAWKQLRADFREIAAGGGKSAAVRDGDDVFNQLTLTTFLQNETVRKTEIAALVAAISRLEGIDPAKKTAQIKTTFETGSPVSEAMRDFLEAITAEARPSLAPEAERAETAVDDSKKGKPPGQDMPRADHPEKPGLSLPKVSDRAVVETALEEGVFVKNAGLVLVAPFFRTLFEKTKLLDGNRFLSESHQERAVLLSQYLVTGQRVFDESELLLNKILCGWPPEKTLARHFIPTAREKRAAKELIDSVITHWSALGNISATGFCNTFLIRQGKLVWQDQQFKLLIERKAFDILLEKLPWNISIIRSAWMQYPVWVEW